ncbi:MAG: DUF805 domain-containing protein [Brevundimonas sp.]|uniref:DUF805 domain-containing protein n=1 Tax=Brevundimonas sp. TaxID=1871086 RepID=UPI00273240EE|nr:DUF805 domain-containing protein [Brevundimonas sp.]MDP3403630.1 DUF805 domain-containing protein [Brevundimonas sp.]
MNSFIIPYKRYVDFGGRSDRKEFWYYFLFYLIVSAMLSVLDRAVFPSALDVDGDLLQPLTSIFAIGSLVPNISVSVRRLHDTGRSGWWALLWLIPIFGWLMLLIWFSQKGQPGLNAYGAAPSGSAAFDGDEASI